MSRKILTHLWQVGGEGLTVPGDAAAYLIRFGDRAALIDAGCGRAHARLAANIDECLGGQARLSHLLLTHCHYDHCGGAEAVRQTFGCQIVAHTLDADLLLEGHFGIMEGQAAVRRFIHSYLEA
jgi:glyoxylase-like metal-dependent hydrolase (beta-lactamase superfamily II)